MFEEEPLVIMIEESCQIYQEILSKISRMKKEARSCAYDLMTMLDNLTCFTALLKVDFESRGHSTLLFILKQARKVDFNIDFTQLSVGDSNIRP